MRITVLWSAQAEVSLASLWVDAAQRRLVSQAADEVDSLLREQAARIGESRSDGTRILFIPPLGACYEIFAEDRQVVVWDVWQYRKRSQ